MVWLCISLTISDVEYLFMYLYVFGKMSVQVLCPLFNQVACFTDVELYAFFIYFVYEPFIKYMIFKYLLPCCTPEINVLHVIYIFILKKEFER